MRTYSELGTNVEYISYSDTFQLPEKCIVMNGPRPDPTYYADENGEWLPGPAPRVLQQMIIEVTQKQTAILSHASDIIAALLLMRLRGWWIVKKMCQINCDLI